MGDVIDYPTYPAAGLNFQHSILLACPSGKQVFSFTSPGHLLACPIILPHGYGYRLPLRGKSGWFLR